MFSIKKQIVSIVKTLGLVAIIAALAATAFPTGSYASALNSTPAGNILPDGKLAVTVVSSITGAPLNGAEVRVMNAQGVQVAKEATGAGGNVSFKLQPGIYKVNVTAFGYKGNSSVATVLPNDLTEIKAALDSNGIRPRTSGK